MPLKLVATPIGDPRDITMRAVDVLKEAEVVIGEERKEVSKLMKALGIEGKRLELLNEHSREADVLDLLALCRTQTVALVSDCGTPGFCDPGARLVAACRREGILISPVPGASSLMCLMSVSGEDLRQFLFRGFLPVDRMERAQAIRELDRESRPVVLMDTPYRLERLLSELAERWPEKRALLGCDFTSAQEQIFEAKLKDLPALVGERKAEFMLVVYPATGGNVSIAAPGRTAGGAQKRHRPSPEVQEKVTASYRNQWKGYVPLSKRAGKAAGAAGDSGSGSGPAKKSSRGPAPKRRK